MAESLILLWAELIIEELIRGGCTCFCVCPGSRSTPLAMAVARNPRAQSIICHDERGAAFHALGCSRGSNHPVAVITTSGSAAANLLPAVTEASNDHVPLFLLTADRPPELQECGANQTMPQTRLFDSFVRWRFDIPCPTVEIAPEFLLTSIDQALFRSTAVNPGPVHLNCMYREPFFTALPPNDYQRNILNWRNRETPFTRYTVPVLAPTEADTTEIAARISQTQRGILFIGGLTSHGQRDAIHLLAQKLNWPVYADITSGLRLTSYPTHLMRYIDGELQPDAFNQAIRPEVVLHFGARVISKRVGLFLTRYRPDHYIVVKETPDRLDPIHAVTCHVQCDIARFARNLAASITPVPASPYTHLCNSAAKSIDTIISRTTSDDPALSEVHVARRITELVPEGATLAISSSMPVRDVDIYGVSGRRRVNAIANRGVSGIDGVIALAAGVAQGSEAPVVLLIGDIAALHDINSLSLLRECRHPVIAVIVNNQGGGIFHFLPVAQHPDVFERFFRTPHEFVFKGAGDLFRIPYHNPDTKAAFDSAVQTAIASRTHAIIEVNTSSTAGFALRKKIKKEILEFFKGMV